jgi:hypothetical protein
MIKSSSKTFKERVQGYIIDCMEDGVHDTRECLQQAIEHFKAWYCDYNRKRYPNIINALMQHFNDGSINIAHYYSEQREILAEWYEENATQVSKYDDAQVSSNFYCHIARNLLALCKEYNVSVED